MDYKRELFKIYDELDLISFHLTGVYQTLFAVDLEVLSTFVDDKGKAAQSFICHELMELIKRLKKCDVDLHQLMIESPLLKANIKQESDN